MSNLTLCTIQLGIICFAIMVLFISLGWKLMASSARQPELASSLFTQCLAMAGMGEFLFMIALFSTLAFTWVNCGRV